MYIEKMENEMLPTSDAVKVARRKMFVVSFAYIYMTRMRCTYYTSFVASYGSSYNTVGARIVMSYGRCNRAFCYIYIWIYA